MVSARIVEETNAGLADEDQIVDDREDSGAQGKSAPRRPRKKSKRSRTATVSEIEKTSQRHQTILRAEFDVLNTDIRYVSFNVKSDTTVSMYPGLLLINATLFKGDYFICAVARYVIDYPETISDIAFALYESMMIDGLGIADFMGA
jgi:hypothetical protein